MKKEANKVTKLTNSASKQVEFEGKFIFPPQKADEEINDDLAEEPLET